MKMDQAQPGVRWFPQGQGRCDPPSGGDHQLVLVAVPFGQATSNLWLIFDASGRIINVDISRDFV